MHSGAVNGEFRSDPIAPAPARTHAPLDVTGAWINPRCERRCCSQRCWTCLLIKKKKKQQPPRTGPHLQPRDGFKRGAVQSEESFFFCWSDFLLGLKLIISCCIHHPDSTAGHQRTNFPPVRSFKKHPAGRGQREELQLFLIILKQR